eukprot:COSAG06_NODE_60305_length_271_cov_0.732558_1_plen_42_part_10
MQLTTICISELALFMVPLAERSLCQYRAGHPTDREVAGVASL